MRWWLGVDLSFCTSKGLCSIIAHGLWEIHFRSHLLVTFEQVLESHELFDLILVEFLCRAGSKFMVFVQLCDDT